MSALSNVLSAIEEARQEGFRRGQADQAAKDAEIARNFKGGFTASLEVENQLLPDPDGPWCLGSDIAEKILATSPDPSYAERVRATYSKALWHAMNTAHNVMTCACAACEDARNVWESDS